MKIIFLSHDGSIHRLIDALSGDIHKAKSEEEVLTLLEDIEEDEECLLFLDYDGDQKKIEKFNKSILKNDWITRIVISGEMKVKDFKKHQKGKTAAHGYVLKPFTGDVFKSILNDLEISYLLEEQGLYEEGQILPDLPTNPQDISGFEGATEEYLEEAQEEADFDPTEFKMSTEVRNLVDLHSVKGDHPPFDGQLNEKIQAKFDEVFGPYDDEEDNYGMADDSFMGGGAPYEEGGLSLREETQESIALDLNNSSDDSDAVLDLGGDDEIDLEANLDLSVDESEEQQEETLFNSGEEIDLEAMDDDGDMDLDGDDIDLDDDEVELDDDSSLDLGEIDEGMNSDNVDLDENLDEELTRLTEERSLPTEDELAEFAEETGEFEIRPNESNDEMQFDKPSNPVSDSSDSGTDEFDLDLDASDSAPEEVSEEMTMSDEDQNDELLEFEEEVEVEGELAFSTEPEAEEGSSNDEDEGGLDFNLGAGDEDSEEELSVQTGAEAEDQSAGGDEGGFELDGGGDDLDGMDLEIGGSAASASSSEDEAGAGGDLDLSDDGEDDGLDLGSDDSDDGMALGSDDDDDEFDLGTDAALSADDSDDDLDLGGDDSQEEVSAARGEDDGLDFGGGEDDPQESVEEAPVAAGSDSEFDDDDLSFADDEDEELEKTQAVSMKDIQAQAMAQEAEEEESLEDELDDDLDDEATNEFEADEELLDDSFGEDTNPTVVMTEEVTRDLQQMKEDDEENDFRPMGMEESGTSLMDEDSFDDVDDFDTGDDTPSAPRAEAKPSRPAPSRRESEEGSLNITPAEDRYPPSFNEGEAVRLQATIRQLREEREELLKEIQDLKKDKRLTEQENLGLKAELDEAKIEISILKKRHSSEVDEMKYRLRITDEKKLYAEEKAKKLQKEFDRLQSKVRIDFNQIKQREKELESQLELVKMDSESQVQSRDKKILELKRKIDQLEFNMENVVIREQKSRDDKVRLEERLERIMKTLRGSIEVLEDDIEFDAESKRNKEK